MITINAPSISPKLLERPLPRLTSKLIAEGHSSPCHQLNQIASLILQYLLVTGAYLAFRISDGVVPVQKLGTALLYLLSPALQLFAVPGR